VSDTPLDRSQFPVTDRYRYLAHAAVAPLPLVAVEAGTRFLDESTRHGIATGFDHWDDQVEQVRSRAARFLGVPGDDVAFVKNTTEGLSFVAGGIDWRPGDRVITMDRDYPSSVYPWLALRDRGVTVDLVAPRGEGWTYPLDAFAEALAAAPTRLVSVSWVHFARGWRVDLAGLAQLCRDHGALLCVDAIQGLGVVPATLADWGVDFAAADAHKWLLGPIGTGVLYVAGDRRDLLRPLEPGWASVAHRHDYDNLELIYDDSARRFEGGSVTVETVLQMGASIDLLAGAGVDRIWAHVQGLLDHLADGLAGAGATVCSDLSPANRSGHLTFTLAGHDPAVVAEQLAADAIVCSPRGGGIRVAPHGYNTLDELDAVVDVVRRLVGR
jgi:cysteine desulfurase / selenocysteine lyase